MSNKDYVYLSGKNKKNKETIYYNKLILKELQYLNRQLRGRG